MFKRTAFYSRIIIGALLIPAGAFLLWNGYESWQDYYTYGFNLEGIVTGLVGATLCFFTGALLLIRNRFYELISIRRCAFVFGLILGIAAGISFVLSCIEWVLSFLRYPFDGISPIAIAIFLLVVFLFSGFLSFIFFLRVREGGGIRRKCQVQATETALIP